MSVDGCPGLYVDRGNHDPVGVDGLEAAGEALPDLVGGQVSAPYAAPRLN